MLNWPKVKSQVLKKWNKLHDSDVEQTKGNREQLKKLVHDHYKDTSRFDAEYKAICENCSQPSAESTATKPYRSPNMTDGWKKGSGMDVGSQSGSNTVTEGSDNPGTDSTWGYNGVDTNSESSDIHPGGQVNTKEFMQSNEPIISDRSYSEAPDEFSPIQNPRSHASDIPLGGGLSSSAKNSSAHNAVFNSFEDHSRSTKKL